MEALRKCVTFCADDSRCRRVMLLEYFGEEFNPALCRGTCDNCQNKGNQSHEQKAVTRHAQLMARIVRAVAGNNGSGKCYNVL